MIQSRVYIHVVPNGSLGWKVKYAGSTGSISAHYRKDNAVDEARRLGRSLWLLHKRPVELVIHKADGTIEEKETYGNDPRKSVG